MDPDPRKEIEVDPDPDLDPERGLKWIRIRPNAVDPDPKRCFQSNIFDTYRASRELLKLHFLPYNYFSTSNVSRDKSIR